MDNTNFLINAALSALRSLRTLPPASGVVRIGAARDVTASRNWIADYDVESVKWHGHALTPTRPSCHRSGMIDPRIEKLADLLINYSCALQAGETILIEAIDIPHEFTKALVRAASAAGGRAIVLLKSNEVQRALMLAGTREQWDTIANVEQHADGARASATSGRAATPMSRNIPMCRRISRRSTRKPSGSACIMTSASRKPAGCVLRWPSPSMAQMAEMSTEAFEDFFFNVCTLDYAKMARAMEPLKHLMEKTDNVRLKGPRDTDLTFSIKGIPAIPCDGRVNIPDGEVFTAPVRDSVNGIIHFNAPTIYRGTTHNDIRLVFRNGKLSKPPARQPKS